MLEANTYDGTLLVKSICFVSLFGETVLRCKLLANRNYMWRNACFDKQYVWRFIPQNDPGYQEFELYFFGADSYVWWSQNWQSQKTSPELRQSLGRQNSLEHTFWEPTRTIDRVGLHWGKSHWGQNFMSAEGPPRCPEQWKQPWTASAGEQLLTWACHPTGPIKLTDGTFIQYRAGLWKYSRSLAYRPQAWELQSKSSG